MKQRPLAAVAAVGVVGVALGGLVFSRIGRLAFAAVVGYVANELWHGEGAIEVDELIERFVS